MDFTTRIINLRRNIERQAEALKSTNDEIDAMRSLPAGTVGVPQALNRLNAERKRQSAILSDNTAHLHILENLADKEAANAKKRTEQAPKRPQLQP